jgi:uncharacterized C2H2 Zn-finger protein
MEQKGLLSDPPDQGSDSWSARPGPGEPEPETTIQDGDDSGEESNQSGDMAENKQDDGNPASEGDDNLGEALDGSNDLEEASNQNEEPENNGEYVKTDMKSEASVRKPLGRNRKHKQQGYDCPDCGEMFTKAKDVMDHGVQEHGGLRCPDCDKRFRLRAGYNQHIKVVHKKERYPCKVCGKDFYSKQALTTHMNMHMGLKPFQCDQCEAAFAGLDSLCKHKRRACKGGVMEATCHICGKEFPRKETLVDHMKQHTQEKAQNFSMAEKIEAVALVRYIEGHALNCFRFKLLL